MKSDVSGISRHLRIMYGYRARLFDGVWHDLRQQYTGSIFGVFWAVLFPLLQLLIYAALYTIIFRVRPSGLNEFSYTLLVFSGLVPLLAFSQAIVAATGALVVNKSLLMNTVFPAELIPLRAALAAHAPVVASLIITLIFGLVLGRTSFMALILVPIWWVLMMMFAIGLGWILSLVTLVARDIQHSMGLILMLMTILSPFAYTPEMVPPALSIILYANPMSYFVLSFQALICYNELPGLIPALGSVVLACLSFFLGLKLFMKSKKVFFDYA